MADSNRSTPHAKRSISPLWGLLLAFPLALGIGWLAGRMPVAPRDPDADPRAAALASLQGGADAAQPLQQVGEVSEWTSYDNAVAESQRRGKPVMIDFNAEWCGPCQALRQDVFENESRGRIVQQAVIPVSIVDRQHEDGENPPRIRELQERFGVHAFPTVVVFSPQTGRSEQSVGFGDADEAVEWISAAARKVH